MITCTRDFEILVDGAAFWSRLQDDIAQAEHSILIQTLSFEGDVAGQGLATALLESHCRDRRLIVDSFNHYFQSDRFVYAPRNLFAPAVQAEVRDTRAMIAALERSGVQVKHTNPAGAVLQRLPARNHKKLVLIDDRIAYIGGINFCEHNFEWHDMMVRIERSEVASSLVRDFNATWHDVIAPQVMQRGDIELLNFDGVRNEVPTERIIARIDAARERICVISPYMTFPFTDALRAARRRGVHVTVISPALNNRGFLCRYMRAEALRSGFELRLYGGRMSHLKGMLIDDTTLIVGSSNFDWLTRYILGEIVAITSNAELIAAFKEQVLEPDLAESVLADANGTRVWQAAFIEALMKVAAAAARRVCRPRRVAAPAGLRAASLNVAHSSHA